MPGISKVPLLLLPPHEGQESTSSNGPLPPIYISWACVVVVYVHCMVGPPIPLSCVGGVATDISPMLFLLRPIHPLSCLSFSPPPKRGREEGGEAQREGIARVVGRWVVHGSHLVLFLSLDPPPKSAKDSSGREKRFCQCF